jgi:hypothetical protein
MLNVMSSTAESKNPGLVGSIRKPDEDNVEWLERQLKAPEMRREVSAGSAPDDATTTGDRTPTYVILFGGSDRSAFRLRLIGLTSPCWARRRRNSAKQISMRFRCSRV